MAEIEERTRADVRRLLRTFGVQADQAIVDHLARNPIPGPLRVRVILEDLTAYGEMPPDQQLYLEIEAEIRTPPATAT